MLQKSIILKRFLSADPFKVLQLPTNATDDEVKKAYIKLTKKYHPDVYDDDGQKFQQVHNAYKIISKRAVIEEITIKSDNEERERIRREELMEYVKLRQSIDYDNFKGTKSKKAWNFYYFIRVLCYLSFIPPILAVSGYWESVMDCFPDAYESTKKRRACVELASQKFVQDTTIKTQR